MLEGMNFALGAQSAQPAQPILFAPSNQESIYKPTSTDVGKRLDFSPSFDVDTDLSKHGLRGGAGPGADNVINNEKVKQNEREGECG